MPAKMTMRNQISPERYPSSQVYKHKCKLSLPSDIPAHLGLRPKKPSFKKPRTPMFTPALVKAAEHRPSKMSTFRMKPKSNVAHTENDLIAMKDYH